MRCAIADALKREGNTLFIEKKYAEAEALYSKALGHDPTNKFILGNRSVTRRHLGNFSGALEDATAAVHAAPDWAKVRICVPACFLEPAWLTVHVCVVWRHRRVTSGKQRRCSAWIGPEMLPLPARLPTALIRRPLASPGNGMRA